MPKGLIVRALGGFNIHTLIRAHGLMASGAAAVIARVKRLLTMKVGF